MTIKDMHYDFKKKLNKVDSQQNRNLLIPEIDWSLNEAQELFVKMIAEPRMKSYLGFEKSQRNTDDIRTLVVNNKTLTMTNPLPGYKSYNLPEDYWHFVSATSEIVKGNCEAKARVYIRQQDDDFENSPFDKSSFEWRTLNAVFVDNRLRVYNDDFGIKEMYLNYIKKPSYIHNAEDFQSGEYRLPNGTLLTGSVDCELPEHTHREIVDIAVMLVSGELQLADYQIKFNKVNMNLK